MKKVVFLDIDGVLNSEASLMEDDSLEEALILNLKELVEKTGAEIILSSSWRVLFNSLRRLMDRLGKVGLHISGLTPDGVSWKWIENHNLKPSAKYRDTYTNWEGKKIDITTDRGAEIFKWLSDHKEVESFVILDDEDFDIKNYFPDKLIKTNFKTGLTKENVEKAIQILNNN